MSNTSPRTTQETLNGVRLVRAASMGVLASTSICPTMPFLATRWRPDIVQVHLPNPMGHLAAAFIPGRPRLVVMWHSDIIKQRAGLALYRPFLHSLLDRADRIVATSPAYVEFSPFLRPRRSKCSIIPLGVDPSRFELDGRQRTLANEIRARHGRRIVLFVGRLAYYKGASFLLKAMKEVRGTLLLVGEGPEEARLKDEALALGLGTNAVFCGAVPHADLPAYLHASTVFSLPSVEPSEAFGIAQLEAMVCGKPVVSTTLPTGVPWVNQHGQTGLTVPPRDPAALAEALNSLLNDPAACAKLGAAGRQRALTTFHRERVARDFLSLYREML